MTRNTYADGEPFSVAALNAQKHAHADEGVISGGELSLGSGNFEIEVSAVEYAIGGETFSTGSETVVLAEAGGGDRLDLVVATDTEAIEVEQGSEASVSGQPNAPDIPEGSVLLGAVFVPEGAEELLPSSVFGDYKTVVGLQTVQFVQSDEPVATTGSTWFNPETGELSVGFNGEWFPTASEEQIQDAAIIWSEGFAPGFGG